MSSTSPEAPAGDAAASHHGARPGDASTMCCGGSLRHMPDTVLFPELWKVRTDL
jgi:tryptophan 2,3-dioxygenase